jgi:cell division protein FtsN
MTSKNNKKNLSKSRSKLRRSGRGRGLPRIMWVAIAVCIIGAVLIFREQGDRMPTGIGEYQSVVTADQEGATLQDQNGPRSGDVDISDQTTALTPEKPAGESGPTEDKPAAKPPVKKTTTSKPTNTKPANTKPEPAPVLITPAASGPYLVQTGSFGKSENANKEANRLKKLGFDARIKTVNTADNSLIFRVRIGYFKSRTETEAFIRQNRKNMPGAIPAHR